MSLSCTGRLPHWPKGLPMRTVLLNPMQCSLYRGETISTAVFTRRSDRERQLPSQERTLLFQPGTCGGLQLKERCSRRRRALAGLLGAGTAPLLAQHLAHWEEVAGCSERGRR